MLTSSNWTDINESGKFLYAIIKKIKRDLRKTNELEEKIRLYHVSIQAVGQLNNLIKSNKMQEDIDELKNKLGIQ